MLAALTSHTHLNRTQVIEQAILRMSRQEGLIAPPTPIELLSADGFATTGNDAFARIWDTPEEDAAWAHLPGGEVVLVPFPFSTGAGEKRRRAYATQHRPPDIYCHEQRNADHSIYRHVGGGHTNLLNSRADI